MATIAGLGSGCVTYWVLCLGNGASKVPFAIQRAKKSNYMVSFDVVTFNFEVTVKDKLGSML